MIHSLLKLVLLFVLLFTACISLIHAQPRDDSDLLTFLTPPNGCPMPCFMGIRPGAMTAEEAVAILDAHEWVGEVEVSLNDVTRRPDTLLWNWSGSQPGFIQDTIFGNPYRGNLRVRDGIVSAIWIPTTVSLGDIWLVWGQPDEFAFSLFRRVDEDGQPLFLSYFNIFSERRLVSQTFAYCPYFPINWYSPVAITLGDINDVVFISENETSTYSRFVERIVNLRHSFC